MAYPLLFYIISGVMILCAVTISIWAIIRYYRNKINMIFEEFNKTPDTPLPTMNGNERIKYTNDLLDFIDNTIQLELLNEKRFDIFLDQKSKNLDFDEVLKRVSTNTFNAIETDVFTDPNLIVTKEYLMRYIQKRVFFTYFTYIQKNVADRM